MAANDLNTQIEQACERLLSAVNLELLAKSECHRAELNQEIRLREPVKLAAWLKDSIQTLPSLLDGALVAHNPADPDNTVEWRTARDYLEEQLCEAYQAELERALGVVRTCGCCRGAYTKATWEELGVAHHRFGPSIKTCPCMAREEAAA